MRTGSGDWLTALFSSTASKPISSACAAWLGAPRPASMISTTPGRRSRNRRSANGFISPWPEPMGAPQGISSGQPASSRRRAVTRSSVQYGNTVKPSRASCRAASTSSCGSGCRV